MHIKTTVRGAWTLLGGGIIWLPRIGGVRTPSHVVLYFEDDLERKRRAKPLLPPRQWWVRNLNNPAAALVALKWMRLPSLRWLTPPSQPIRLDSNADYNIGKYYHFSPRECTGKLSNRENKSNPANEDSQVNNPSDSHQTWRTGHEKGHWTQKTVWYRMEGKAGLNTKKGEMGQLDTAETNEGKWG